MKPASRKRAEGEPREREELRMSLDPELMYEDDDSCFPCGNCGNSRFMDEDGWVPECDGCGDDEYYVYEEEGAP